MKKEELKQMMIDNMELSVQMCKEHGELYVEVSLYFGDEEILQSKDSYPLERDYDDID